MKFQTIKYSMAAHIEHMNITEFNSFITINQSEFPAYKNMFDEWLKEKFNESPETSDQSNKTGETPASRNEDSKISDNFGC